MIDLSMINLIYKDWFFKQWSHLTPSLIKITLSGDLVNGRMAETGSDEEVVRSSTLYSSTSSLSSASPLHSDSVAHQAQVTRSREWWPRGPSFARYRFKCSLRVEFEGAAVHTPREKTAITTLVNLPSLGDVIQSGRVYITLLFELS